MIHLVYISSATTWPTEENLADLLNQSRINNQKNQITGMLLYHNATYMQVLEGDAEPVHRIFKAISDDPRTTGIVKLLEEEIRQRDFTDWKMGFKKLERQEIENIPGFIDIFNGEFNQETIIKNKSTVINLLMGFAKNFH